MKLDEYNISDKKLLEELKELTDSAHNIDPNSDEFLMLATEAFKRINAMKDQ